MAAGGQAGTITLQSLQSLDAVAESFVFKQLLCDPDFQQYAIKALKDTSDVQPQELVATSQYYDATIVHAAGDKKEAERVKEFMNSLVLEKNERPKVCLFTKAEFDGSDVKLPNVLIDRCSLIFALLTDSFEHDDTVQFLNEETVAGTRLKTGKHGQRYSVRPLHTQSKEERKYPIPFGLASVHSYDVYNFDDHTQNTFKDLFQYHLYLRKRREYYSMKSEKENLMKDIVQAQANNKDMNDNGQNADIQDKEGRLSLSESVQMSSKSKDASDGKPHPPSSVLSPPEAAGDGQDVSEDRMTGASVQEVNEDHNAVAEIRLLSETRLLNDHGITTNTMTEAEESKSTDNLHAVHPAETKLKAVYADESNPSETTVAKEESMDLFVQNTMSKNSTPMDSKSLEMQTKMTSKSNSFEERMQLRPSPEGQTTSLGEKDRRLFTEDITDDDDDVEEDDKEENGVKEETSLPSYNLSNQNRNIATGATDKNDKSEQFEETEALYAQCSSENDPDQTEVQSDISIPRPTNQPMKQDMALCKDSEPSFVDTPGTSTGDTLDKKYLGSISSLGDIDDMQKEISELENYEGRHLKESLPAESPMSKCVDRYSHTTIIEPTLMTSGQAYTKGRGLSASPDADFSCYADMVPTNNKTLPNGFDRSTVNTEQTESIFPKSIGEEVEKDDQSQPGGTQLPLENVGKTFVYIYNSSNIRIEGENNIHMKSDKPDTPNPQKTKDTTKQETSDEGRDPGWLPPNRQKQQMIDNQPSNHPSTQNWSDESSDGKSPAPKMLSKGDNPAEYTSQPSSATDLSVSTGAQSSSFVLVKTKSISATDVNCKNESAEKGLVEKDGSKTSDDSVGICSSSSLTEVAGQDEECSAKKKSKSCGCFPVRFKRRKKKRNDVTAS